MEEAGHRAIDEPIERASLPPDDRRHVPGIEALDHSRNERSAATEIERSEPRCRRRIHAEGGEPRNLPGAARARDASEHAGTEPGGRSLGVAELVGPGLAGGDGLAREDGSAIGVQGQQDREAVKAATVEVAERGLKTRTVGHIRGRVRQSILSGWGERSGVVSCGVYRARAPLPTT